MNIQKDPKDVADAFAGNIVYMRTLLRAAKDKVRFYLSDRDLLGPYEEVLSRHAAETDDLLALMGRFLDKMDRDMDTVTDLLYAIEPPQAEHP